MYRIQDLAESVRLEEQQIISYQQQGLFVNKENGEYTAVDLRNLRKIHILRKLQIPRLRILRVLEGKMTFGTMMREKDEEVYLTLEAFELELLEEMGQEYATVEGEEYIPPITEDNKKIWLREYLKRDEDYPSLPWRRYFARSIDSTFYVFIFNFILRFAFKINIEVGGMIASLILSLIILFLVEPICLSCFSTTVGKSVFGLKITSQTGEKLTFKEAFDRTCKIWRIGLGFYIPFYDMYRSYKCYQICKDNRVLPWDEKISYTVKDKAGWRCVWSVVFMCILSFVSNNYLTTIPKPPNRGEITVAQFAENYNFYQRYYEGWFVYGKMDEDGVWRRTSDLETVSEPRWEYVVKDGYVEEVIYTSKENRVLFDWSEFISEDGEHKKLATIFAIAGAQDNFDWNFESKNLEGKVSYDYYVSRWYIDGIDFSEEIKSDVSDEEGLEYEDSYDGLAKETVVLKISKAS